MSHSNTQEHLQGHKYPLKVDVTTSGHHLEEAKTSTVRRKKLPIKMDLEMLTGIVVREETQLLRSLSVGEAESRLRQARASPAVKHSVWKELLPVIL